MTLTRPSTLLLTLVTSCSTSLHSQLSDVFRTERLHPAAGGRAAGASGSSASLCGSLPRQAPPPVPLTKPVRDCGLSAGVGPHTLTIPAYGHNSGTGPTASPRLPRHPDRDREWGSLRRGSFVERCQERAKGSEAGSGFGVPAGTEGVRRSLAVCSELEARFGLRTPTTFSVSPGARHSSGTPSSLSSSSPLSSSSSHRRSTPISPTSPAPPPAMSPTRSQAPASPCRPAAASRATSPADVPASPESPASPDSPAVGPPTSPKPHMNETSF